MGTTEDSYGQALVSGILDIIEGLPWRLLCVSCGTIRSTHGMEAQRNVLYEIMDERGLDALILAGSLSHNVSEAELLSFCSNFGSIPIVTMSVVLPGLPSVITDNRGGMQAMMDHLLDVHSYRRLAFIGGPVGQQEAELRQQVFLDSLAHRGIAPVPQWLTHGDYTRVSGEDAALRILEAKMDPPFQVIVCANDSMAFGARDALAEKGILAGRDYYLTGFDDMSESRFMDPPLSTIRQSVRSQAGEAARIVIGLSQGAEVKSEGRVPADLVLRRSCGCPPSHLVEHDEGHGSDASDAALRQEWRESGPGSPAPSPEAFFKSIDALFHAGPPVDACEFWQAKLGALRHRLIGESQGGCLRAEEEEALHRARLLVFSLEKRRNAELSLSRDVLTEKMHGFREALVTSFRLPEIFEILERDLPGLGIDGAWLSLFDKPALPAEGASLHFAMAESRGLRVPATGLAFESRDIIPWGLRSIKPSQPLLLLEALYSREERLGFVLFSAKPNSAFLSGSLRTHISASIHGALLLEERRRREDQLMESEKLASLGSLVAGVAHDINTPLGVAMTAASYLEGRAREFKRLLESGALKKSQLAEWVEQTGETGGIIHSNLQRAADLVSSFKQVAADQAGEFRRRFDLRAYLDETLLSLRPQWKRQRVRVSLEGPEKLEVDSYPGAIAQIVTNIVVNALTHAFLPQADGELRLSLSLEGEMVRLRIQDNGQGIAPDIIDRVFDPFFTTKRDQGGTGLGLHIVASLARQPLGGRVSCSSNLGQGSVFEVILPRNAP